jgi:hypothetical protein
LRRKETKKKKKTHNSFFFLFYAVVFVFVVVVDVISLKLKLSILFNDNNFYNVCFFFLFLKYIFSPYLCVKANSRTVYTFIITRLWGGWAGRGGIIRMK